MTEITGLRILVVEDDNAFIEMIQRLMLPPILAAVPQSVVTFVQTIAEMENALNAIQQPDITLLDLTVPPHGFRDVLGRLDDIEQRTPVVILTGSQESQVRAIIGNRLTPIVEKTMAVSKPGVLHNAIVFAVEKWHNHKWARFREHINRMKAIGHGPTG